MVLYSKQNHCYFDLTKNCSHANCRNNHLNNSKLKEELSKIIKNPTLYFPRNYLKNTIKKALNLGNRNVYITTCSAILQGRKCNNECCKRTKTIQVKYKNSALNLDICYGDSSDKNKSLFVGVHISDIEYIEKPFKIIRFIPYVKSVILTREQIKEKEEKKKEASVKEALSSFNFPSLQSKSKKIDGDIEDGWKTIPSKKSIQPVISKKKEVDPYWCEKKTVKPVKKQNIVKKSKKAQLKFIELDKTPNKCKIPTINRNDHNYQNEHDDLFYDNLSFGLYDNQLKMNTLNMLSEISVF